MLEKLRALNTNLDKLLDQLDQLKKENDQLRDQLKSVDQNQENTASGGNGIKGNSVEVSELKEKIDANISEIDRAIEILSQP